jgi:hypothetical protein
MTGTPVHVVAIVVDPRFGDRLAELLEHMPVWMADAEANHAAAARARTALGQSQTGNHTAIGALTTFMIDSDSAPESWCLEILDTVAGHHDQYSHSPGLLGGGDLRRESVPDVAGCLGRIPTYGHHSFRRWISGEHGRWRASRIAKRFVAFREPSARDRTPLLVIDAQDQELVWVTLVVDSERRHAPTPHDSTRTEP